MCLPACLSTAMGSALCQLCAFGKPVLKQTRARTTDEGRKGVLECHGASQCVSQRASCLTSNASLQHAVVRCSTIVAACVVVGTFVFSIPANTRSLLTSSTIGLEHTKSICLITPRSVGSRCPGACVSPSLHTTQIGGCLKTRPTPSPPKQTAWGCMAKGMCNDGK